jgi:hypothetical protein
MCEACYAPQWSDALRDWEFVEDAAGPCGACQVLQMDAARILDRKDLRAPLPDRAVVLTDFAPGMPRELGARAAESVDRGGGTLGTRAEYDALFDAVAPGAGARKGSR